MHPAATFHRRPEMQSAALTHIHIHLFSISISLSLSSSHRTRQSIVASRALPPPQAHNVQSSFAAPTKEKMFPPPDATVTPLRKPSIDFSTLDEKVTTNSN
ncbi:hypothetical protein PIB30_020766 [Stylosanthes scabra]|uniref:Uncharacterized protein n=1 Tax=Stylosanthes scabra TaxID=79078 RepID=A0ABU6Q8I7_9FABA|nr:hypothetical protein [Stylosanthes scabra]